MTSRPREAVAALLLLLAGALYFVLVEAHRPSIVAANDIYSYFMPNMLHAVHSVWDGGRGLLWNPLQGCGEPFFANTVNGLLYPPHLLFLVLEPNVAVHAVLIINMVVGSAGMLLLVRELGLGWIAAIGGALAFELGDPMVQLTSWSPMHNGPWVWVPWALLFCERLLRAPTRAGVVGLAVVLALELLPGFVLITALTYQLIALRVAWELVARPGQRPWRSVLAVGAGLTLAPLLVAIQLVPAAEYAGESLRAMGGTSPIAPSWTRRTNIALSETFARIAARHMPVPFLAALLLLAGVAPLASGTWRLATFYLVIGALYAVLALGEATPLFSLYVTLPPGEATIRSHYRLFWMSGLSLSLLTAFAIEAVARAGERTHLRWVGLIVVSTVAATLYAFAPGGLRWSEVAAVAAIAMAVCAASIRPALGRPAAWIIVAAVVLNLVAVPLRWPGQLMPSADVLWSHAATFAALRPSITPQHRVYIVPDIATQMQFTLMQKTATVMRVPGLHDYEALLGRRFSEYYVRLWQDISPRRRRPPDFPQSFRLLENASVRYLIASTSRDLVEKMGFPRVFESVPDLHIYLNDSALPRARYVPRIEVVPDAKTLLNRLAAGSDNLSAVAFVEETAPSSFVGAPGLHGAGAARFVTDDPEYVAIDVDAPERGFLVLTDTYYPGWRATVNGVAVLIRRANYMFRLVEVPAGRSRVEFRYRPTSVVIGAAISLLTAALLAFLWRGGRQSAARRQSSVGSIETSSRHLSVPAPPDRELRDRTGLR